MTKPRSDPNPLLATSFFHVNFCDVADSVADSSIGIDFEASESPQNSRTLCFVDEKILALAQNSYDKKNFIIKNFY